MTLGEKIRYLREVEGSLRELGRPMTQQEIVRAVKDENGKTISQSYLSQIERGSRRHMTQSSRTLLAKFFKVHPGFLVDDPDGYHTELTSDLRTTEGKLDVWLLQQPSLIDKRKRAVLPAVRERQSLADALARHLVMLGLECQRKVKSLGELLTESDHEPIADNSNGKAEAVQ